MKYNEVGTSGNKYGISNMQTQRQRHQRVVHVSLHCNTLQHAATHCNTLQHTATHCNTLQHIRKTESQRRQRSCIVFQHNTLRHTATRCNTLQHTATHCNTTHCTATHCTASAQSKSVYFEGVMSFPHTHSPARRKYLYKYVFIYLFIRT